MYGSSSARALYGMGDYQARSGYAGGYYAAGGFFSGLKKLAGKAVAVAGSKTFAGGLLRTVAPIVAPGLGHALSVAGALRGSPTMRKVAGIAAPALTRFGPGGKLVAGVIGGGMALERGTRKKKRALRAVEEPRRRRATRRAPARGRARSKRRRGDYGDNWRGNTPSRAKGTGQFLTREGGRRRRRGGRGGRVSFVTKSGRRVSFTARRGDGEE